MQSGTTGLVFEEIYLWHDTGSAAAIFPPGLTIQPAEHAESAETKRRFRNLLEVSGLLPQLRMIKAYPCTEEDLTRVHSHEYVDRIKRLSADRGGDAGEITPFGHGSFEIALLSAGGTIQAVTAVVKGQVKNAYALVRPPGHHAEHDRGRGFCIFGNIAVAVKHARAVLGIGRVAVVDWDVHHGNGTQQAFYADSDVLTISLHQDNFYPYDSGHVTDNGSGAGLGYNINIPLPPGCGVGAYSAAFQRVVLPALRKFKPDLIIVASGFDAGGIDPLGRMMLHSECYRDMTRMLMEAADDLCGGRLVLSHEGGYSAAHVPYCGLAVMEQLSGRRTSIADPFLPLMQAWGHQDLQPHQETAIERARALLVHLP
jgi:acetoin utilization deacetylase AcuC-like enzyme